MTDMEYRRLGRSGLQVSVLSFGSWVTFGTQLDTGLARGLPRRPAHDGGVNFFDNAEVVRRRRVRADHGRGHRRARLGRGTSYVISTKFFWGIHDGVNMRNTLNRKYLLQAIDGSLERLGLDFVDLLFCHRPDPNTPIEETVWAMSDIIAAGKALYWGTSEWTADEIRAAWEIAERHHLHKPVMEQPQYNLFERRRVEQEYARLYDDIGLGLTTGARWRRACSPASTSTACPTDSRAALPGYEWLRGLAHRPGAQREGAGSSQGIADELGCTLSQLADRVVRREPARLDGHHRRQPRRAGAGEPRRPRRPPDASTTT